MSARYQDARGSGSGSAQGFRFGPIPPGRYSVVSLEGPTSCRTTQLSLLKPKSPLTDQSATSRRLGRLPEKTSAARKLPLDDEQSARKLKVPTSAAHKSEKRTLSKTPAACFHTRSGDFFCPFSTSRKREGEFRDCSASRISLGYLGQARIRPLRQRPHRP